MNATSFVTRWPSVAKIRNLSPFLHTQVKAAKYLTNIGRISIGLCSDIKETP